MPNTHADKALIQRHFDRAAHSYREAAVLHREVAERMLQRLDLVNLNARRVLDVGCGPGIATNDLIKRYKKAEVVAVDLSPEMLKQAQATQPWYRKLKTVCTDMEDMPFEDDSVDLVYSNLAMQWADPEKVFREFQRVLRPGGLLMFTTFGPDTLKELRESWTHADSDAHVNNLVDMHDLGDALVQTRFAEPVMDMEMFTLQYDDAMGVMRDLKAIGADTVHGARRGLTTPRQVKAMINHYNTMANNGKVPATYEVIYGHAWASAADGQQAVQFQR